MFDASCFFVYLKKNIKKVKISSSLMFPLIFFFIDYGAQGVKNTVGKDHKKYKYVFVVVISGLKYFYLNRSRTTYQLHESENAFKCNHANCLVF